VSGGFRRSSVFGIVGVVVVAVLAAVIALTADQGDPNPKPTLALIFGVIAVFVVGLLALQRSDLERAAQGEAAKASRGAAEAGRPVENPTALTEPELWAAMAVAPIDAEALRAREQGWEIGRHNLRLGALVFALILLTVPAIYLLESFVPLLIGGPLILAAAIYGAVRAIAPGGEIDRGFDRLDETMVPLGLRISERPKGGFELRGPTMPGADYRLRGPTVLSGERHGRVVTVRLGGHGDAGASEVSVAAPGCHEFAADSKLVAVRSGPEGIVVSRRRDGAAAWLCDLWLAERLATG
jgi:hypothetical protein